MIKYMLDTDISIYVINQRPVRILDTFNKHAELTPRSGYRTPNRHNGPWTNFPVKDSLLAAAEDNWARITK